MVTVRSALRRGRCLLGSAVAFLYTRAARPESRPAPPLALACVYRSKNGANVRRMLDTHHFGADRVALWALDECSPSLSEVTVGVGPGGRFELLRHCVDSLDPAEDVWWVLADDDVKVRALGLRRAAAIAQCMKLDVCQPAHAWNSYFTYPFTLAQELVVGRRTDFIEIGPMLLIAPSARHLINELGQDSLMGWGVDIRWAAASRRGEVRMGIVDLVRMRHLRRPGKEYATGIEQSALTMALREVGASSALELQRTRFTWWMWERDANAGSA